MRKAVLAVIIFVLCFALVPVQSLSAGQDIIHRETKEIQLAQDVVYRRITQFTDQGWDKIHVLEADISDPHTRLDILTPPEGIGTGSTLSEMINSTETIAAINGDFFIAGEIFSPIGPLVRDGELQSSPTYRKDELAVFSLDNKNMPIIDYWDWEIKLAAGDLELFVSAVNKISNEYTHPVVYTQEWGPKAPIANFEDIIYVIIDKDRVYNIVQSPAEEVFIPEGGTVIMARGDTASDLLGALESQTPIELQTVSTPDYENMSLAIGGGSTLVKDGRISTFTHSIEGNHPRTAIGFSKNGRKIIAVTVEGRVQGSKGMTQTQLAQLLIDLGAYQGINLDGGGSSTMLARKPGDEVPSLVNTPSDGSLRRISNGISINSERPKGSLAYILLEVEDTNVFAGTGREIRIKGCDSNFNPIAVDPGRVNWTAYGVEGIFKQNVFYPAAEGSAVITADYMGKSAKIDLRVLDKPVLLSTPRALKTDTGQSLAFNVYGKNASGYSALIENKDLSIQTAIGFIKGQSFLSGDKEGTGEMRIGFGGIEQKIPVSVGYRRVLLDSFEGLRGRFASYPDSVAGYYTLDRDHPYGGGAAGKLAYDFTSVDVTAASYLVFGDDGVKLDTLPERLGVYVYSPKPSSHWLRMLVEDSTGKSVTLDLARKIDWIDYKFIHALVPSNLTPPVYIKRIYVVETNPVMHDTGEIYLDNLTALYTHDLKEGYGTVETVIHDVKRVNETPKDYSFGFTMFGSTTVNRLIDIHVVNRMKKLAEEWGEMAIFAGKIGDDTLSGLSVPTISTGGGYSVAKYDNNTFLQLDNSPGGLRAYSPEQWHWLKQQLDSIKGGNLFVILPRPVWGNNGFTDILEAELFNSYLSGLHENKGVEVTVLTGGEAAYRYDILNGVRYIGLNGTAIVPEGASNLDNYNCIRFFIGGDGAVTYQVTPMFDK